MAEVSDFQCTVVSVVPFKISETKPGLIPGRWEIPAARDGEVKILHVGQCFHFVYLDETRGSMQVFDPPQQVARAIVEDYVGAQLGVEEGTQPGLGFIPEKLSVEEVKLKFKGLIEKLREGQKRWFVAICKLADDDWARYGRHNAISDFQRFAARELGYDSGQHPWMQPEIALTSQKCPACGIAYPQGQVICQTCKCVLDPERFKALKFA